MPRAAAGTPKAIANAMKAKGLQKLRWYCQVCEKQCRDENGFKCHTQSEGHLRQMLVVGENAGKHIADYSSQFKSDFMGMLSRRWGTKRVKANTVYQEYISDRNHSHMNATRWVSLTEFVKYLGREGLAHVDETEKGWFIEWIDNSPKALARQDAQKKKDRMEMDDEQRQRKFLEEQIERAKEGVIASGSGNGDVETAAQVEEEIGRELKREEGQKLSFSLKKKSATPPTTEITTTSDPTSPTSNTATPSIPKPSIKTNVFKMASKSTTSNPLASKNALKNPLSRPSTSVSNSTKPFHLMSAAEQIMQGEMERKRKREERTWSGEGGYGADGLNVKRTRV